MGLSELLKKIDTNREKINKRRPLTAEEVRELDLYYRIGTTYSSNALEGNSLTLTETKVLLEDGITVGGKPIKDFCEATGHAKAFDFMLSAARSENLIYTIYTEKPADEPFFLLIAECELEAQRDYNRMFRIER